MTEPLVSHGRGGEVPLFYKRDNYSLLSGAANIRKDTTQYVDGSIIRQGPQGDQGNGAYSSGVSASIYRAYLSIDAIPIFSFPEISRTTLCTVPSFRLQLLASFQHANRE